MGGAGRSGGKGRGRGGRGNGTHDRSRRGRGRGNASDVIDDDEIAPAKLHPEVGDSATSTGAGQGRGKGRGRGASRTGRAEDGGHGGGRDVANAKRDASTSGDSDKKALADSLRSFSTPQWWLICSGLQGKTEEPQLRGKQRGKPEVFQQQCSEKHAEMVKVYESAMSQDSEQRWLRKVCSEGTMGDRVASLTMLIQVCPVLSTGYIKALLGMASRMGRSDCAMAVDALKDLFVGTLLPDRKLKTLAQVEPLTEKFLGKAAFVEYCVVTHFEDYLKTAYAAFVQVLGEAAHSAVVFLKTKAIRVAADLLAAKPEQERALLGMLVNKFGDLAPKVSSIVSFSLSKLQQAHPGMKPIIAKEVEAFLMRPNITQKSQYHALLHLTEMVLSKREEDSKLAAQLIRIYVVRLEEALKPTPPSKKAKEKFRRKKQKRVKRRRGSLQEDDNRLIRTLINGIQRALPYLEAGLVTGSPLEKDTVDALFKVCHTVSAFSTRIAILSLLYRCLFARGNEMPDRFYRLLYEQVVQFDFWNCAHRLKALVLLRRCVPADVSLTRGVAVSRRLLQVGANAEPAVAAAGLSVLRELLLAHRAEIKQLLGTADKDVKPPSALDDDAQEVFYDDDVAAAKSGGNAPDGNTAAHDFYEPMAREPKHAKARHTPMWELHALARHVHPFVAHGASRLLAHEPFEDTGSNPFEDLSCNELLEQFAYVNRVKGRAKSGGISAGGGKKEDPANKLLFNSEKFAKKKAVLPHERFFQMYFRDSIVRQQQNRKARLRKQHDDDVDEEKIGAADAAVEEEEADRFFDDYLEGQIPKDELGDDGDEDESSMGPDIDDDSHADDDASGSMPSGSDGEMDDGQEDDDDEDEDEEDEAPSGSAKRKAQEDKTPATLQRRAKALKKQHSGAMFASAEDFEELLAEDYAVG